MIKENSQALQTVISIVFVFWVFNTHSQPSFENGKKLFHSGQHQQAKPHFESQLKSSPEHIESIEYLGDIAAYASDWDTAINYYKILVSKKPEHPIYNFKYGGVLGKKAQSISKIRAASLIGDIKKHLHKAAELDPTHIEVRWALIDLYIALPGILGGSEKTALSYANELLKLSKVDGYLALGYIAEYFNKPKDAERYYKQAINIGDSPHTYDKLANLYENKTNEPQKAIATKEISIKKHQRNNLNYQIGKISAMYNVDLEKGLSYLDSYIVNFTSKDGVPLEWAYFRKAQIHRHLNNKTAAQNNIKKALALNVDFKEAKEEHKLINNL